MALSLLARGMRRGAVSRGLRTTDRFWGFRTSGRAGLPDLIDAADHLEPGTTEWMVHPGAVATADGCLRDAELAALTSVDLRDALERRNVRLASFRDLASESDGPWATPE
jgi:hypothetical protein